MTPRTLRVLLCLLLSFGITSAWSGCDDGGSSTTDDARDGTGTSTAPPGDIPTGDSPGGAGDGGGVDVPPPEPGTPIVDVAVIDATGTATGADHLVTFGQAFAVGDAPDSVVVTENGEPIATQVDVKRRHTDGSLRHVIITAQVPQMAASSERTLTIATAEAPASIPSDDVGAFLGGGFDVRVVVNGTETASAAAALGDAGNVTWERWLDGALVDEWGATVPIGSDPYLQATFNVRFAGDDAAWVSVSVDNIRAEAPADVSYDVRIEDAAGSELFAQNGVQQSAHARWRKALTWGAYPTALHVRHDIAYLAETGALPRYDPALVLDAGSLEQAWNSWQNASRGILEPGLITEYFPTTGGRGDIGPLPAWTVRALLSGDPRHYEIMLGQGDLSAGVPIHWRDPADGRAWSLDVHPTSSLNDRAQGPVTPEDEIPFCMTGCTSNFTPDDAHQASFVYVPYLLTGDRFYLDELYYWVSWNFIQQNPQYRELGRGLLVSLQVRGIAWTLRTLLHAAWLAPDAHPEAAYLGQMVTNNLEWWNSDGVGSNAMGWWGRQSNSGSDGGRPDDNMAPDVRYYTSPWQSDFVIHTMDWAVRLGWTEAVPVRDWLLGYTIARFSQDPAVYNPYDGAPYHLAVEDDAGNALTDMGVVYQKSFAGRTDPAPTSFNTGCSLCYDVIARTALSCGARDGVAGAQTAYDFIHAEFNGTPSIAEDPTWAIVP